MNENQDNQQPFIPFSGGQLDPQTAAIIKDFLNRQNLVPAGTITGYGGSSAPSGWLICDGSAVSRTTYAALFTAIGTNFGTGDGSTTFTLPDGRKQVMAGFKSGDSNFGAFGNVAAGEVSHTLTTAEMPSHTHDVTVTFFSNATFTTGPSWTGDINQASHTQTDTSTSAGSGGAHNNIQPTFVANYIIKT